MDRDVHSHSTTERLSCCASRQWCSQLPVDSVWVVPTVMFAATSWQSVCLVMSTDNDITATSWQSVCLVSTDSDITATSWQNVCLFVSTDSDITAISWQSVCLVMSTDSDVHSHHAPSSGASSKNIFASSDSGLHWQHWQASGTCGTDRLPAHWVWEEASWH